MSVVIWWIRRDLRLADNSALYAAAQSGNAVIPLYIIDPVLIDSDRYRGPRVAFMLAGLEALAASLPNVGGRLIVRHGRPADVLPNFAREVGAQALHFNRDYSPYATARDTAVTTALQAQGVRVTSYKDLVLHEADEVISKGGKPYNVYTPFRNVWETLPKPAVLPMPSALDTPRDIRSDAIPKPEDHGSAPAAHPIAEAGEAAARERLDTFIAAIIEEYKEERNIPAKDGSSRLSPYLRWGMLSPRTVYDAAAAALERARTPAHRDSVRAWINEVAWREFFYQVLARNPHVATSAFKPLYDTLTWERERSEQLAAWTAGQTGYPIVDAGMRQMHETGWMHNRLRLIVSSFLCKDLLIDYREGERVFMQHLLDGDLASNNGGWQWSAGTGTDSAPYFRIFNPTSQGQRFDPGGEYIRQYVPELRNVPTEYIHEPHRMPDAVQREVGCIIGTDYPAPIVDHAEQRKRALAMYGRVRGED